MALAVLILAIGYGYDRFAKGTAWSWLPFALGVPLLPVFGWLGAAGTVPAVFAILLPTAVVAGAALAIANARADVDRDAAAGVTSVATALGPDRAWVVAAGLFGLRGRRRVGLPAGGGQPARSPSRAPSSGSSSSASGRGSAVTMTRPAASGPGRRRPSGSQSSRRPGSQG